MNYYSKEAKKELKTISPEAMNLLSNHVWTGNVRELQNCIERAVILTDEKEILPQHLGIRPMTSEEMLEQEVVLEGTLHEVSAAATRHRPG